MKKFTISWVSFFDNVLHMEECYAESYKHALVYILTDKLGFSDANYLLTNFSDGELQMHAFDSDCLIQALQTYGD